MNPAKFHEMMEAKEKGGSPRVQFTVEEDRNIIKALYDKTFEAIISRATSLAWDGLGWDIQLHELMPVLLVAESTLTFLDLSFNKLQG